MPGLISYAGVTGSGGYYTSCMYNSDSWSDSSVTSTCIRLFIRIYVFLSHRPHFTESKATENGGFVMADVIHAVVTMAAHSWQWSPLCHSLLVLPHII